MITYLSNVTLLLLNSLIDLFYQLLSRGSGRIWLNNVAYSSFDSCLRSCERCPSNEYHNCVHSEDVTIECGKSLQLCNPDSEKTCFTLLHNFYYFIVMHCFAIIMFVTFSSFFELNAHRVCFWINGFQSTNDLQFWNYYSWFDYQQ